MEKRGRRTEVGVVGGMNDGDEGNGKSLEIFKGGKLWRTDPLSYRRLGLGLRTFGLYIFGIVPVKKF